MNTTTLTKLATIHESFVNGQKEQMVNQIKAYGITKFCVDFYHYCQAYVYYQEPEEIYTNIIYTFFLRKTSNS